jgi:hypothetical protein
MATRVAIFGSASCTGWAFAFEADDNLYNLMKLHARVFNSSDSWHSRNCDGSVELFESVQLALEHQNKAYADCGCEPVSSLDDLFEFYNQDGEGRHIDAAYVMHMLLSDPMSQEWLVRPDSDWFEENSVS